MDDILTEDELWEAEHKYHIISSGFAQRVRLLLGAYNELAAQQNAQSDVCPICAGKRHIQTKSRGLVKCASCNGTGQRR